jgi:hypothetical protein
MPEEKLNISTFQLIIIIFIFVILMVIGFMIQEPNLKISYYLSVGLGIFTIINIYLTITYYMELRNKRGEPGVKGPKGDIGPKGDGGSCVFSTKCNDNKDCDKNVYEKIKDNLTEIDKDISIDCVKNPNKENCGNSEKAEKGDAIKRLADDLIEECKTTRLPEKDFLTRVTNGITALKKL